VHTVTVMQVQINIQHSIILVSQPQDAQYYVIDVTEARCFVPAARISHHHNNIITTTVAQSDNRCYFSLTSPPHHVHS